MKKILYLLILFMPFAYGMEDRKRKNPEVPSKKQTPEKRNKTLDDVVQGNDIIEKDELLRAAVLSDDIMEVKILLEDGANPDLNTNLPGLPKSLLIYAIEKGLNEIVELLNYKCIKRHTEQELFYASIVGNNLEIAKVLLDQGISPDIVTISQNNKIYSPVQFAIKSGFNELARVLMNKRATDKLDGLLIPAVEGNNIECVRYLITQNINLNVDILHNGKSITLVEYAALHGYLDIVKLLVKKGAPFPENFVNQNNSSTYREKEKEHFNHPRMNDEQLENEIGPIPTAEEDQDWLVMRLIEDGKYIQAKTILNKINRMPNQLKKLLEKEIESSNPNSIETMKQLLRLFPTHCELLIGYCVSFYNETTIAKLNYLLNNINDPTLRQWAKMRYSDKLALWLESAVLKNLAPKVKELLEHGANPNVYCWRDGEELPLIAFATRKGYKEVVKLLIQYGANGFVNVNQDSSNKYEEPKEPVKLKNSIAAINSKVIAAFKSRDLGTLQSLLNFTNVNLVDERGFTGLIHGIFFNSPEMVILYLGYGSNINQVDSNGWTPLFWAISGNHIGMVKLLISKGANLNHKDNKRVTPLALSIINKMADISKLLYESGARSH